MIAVIANEGRYGEILMYAYHHRVVKQDCLVFLFAIDWMLDIVNLRFQLFRGVLYSFVAHMGANNVFITTGNSFQLEAQKF